LLVVTEIALAIILLVGAGLMLRSLARLPEYVAGFYGRRHTSSGIIQVTGESRTITSNLCRALSTVAQASLDRARVVAVAANSDPPFVGQRPWYRGEFSIEHQPVDERKQNPQVNYQAVSPDYFRVMEIPLLRGRFFTDSDTVRPNGRRDVAIINQRLAQRMWPNAESARETTQL